MWWAPLAASLADEPPLGNPSEVRIVQNSTAPKLDGAAAKALLKEAREAYLAPFGERRVSLYQRMQALLLSDAASVPFIGENFHLGLRAATRDVWTNSLGTYPVFVDTWLDK